MRGRSLTVFRDEAPSDISPPNIHRARSNAFEYTQMFYNRFRKHPSPEYQNPGELEAKNCPEREQPIVKPNGLPKRQLTHTLTHQENPLFTKLTALHFVSAEAVETNRRLH